MFFIVGSVLLVLLSITLLMLWGHEKIANKKMAPRARIEEYWNGEERRGQARFRKSFEAEYSVEKKPHLKKSRTVDISKGGLRLLLDEKLPSGSIVDLKLYIPGKNKSVEVEGEIIWTKDSEEKDHTGKRFFHSGIKFLRIKEPSGINFSEYIASLEIQNPQG